jgi:hypothetical protein
LDYEVPQLKSIVDATVLPGNRYQVGLDLDGNHDDVTFSLEASPLNAYISDTKLIWPIATSNILPHAFKVKATSGQDCKHSTYSWKVAVPYPYVADLNSTGVPALTGSPALLTLVGSIRKSHEDIQLLSLANQQVKIWCVVFS